MEYQLKGKTALVTGSTSGIGFAIANLLAKEGVQVIINGRSEESISRAMAMLKKENPLARVSGVAADFGDKNSVNALIEKIET